MKLGPHIPELLRFLALHGILGIALGCAIAAALSDHRCRPYRLRLLMGSDAPFLSGFLYFSGFAVTFGSVVMASAVMLLAED